MEHDLYDSVEVFFCLLLYLEMYRLQYVLFASKSVGNNLHGMCRCSPISFLCDATEEEKVPTAFSATNAPLSPPFSLSLSLLSLARSLVCIEVQPIAWVPFHEPRFRRFGF